MKLIIFITLVIWLLGGYVVAGALRSATKTLDQKIKEEIGSDALGWIVILWPITIPVWIAIHWSLKLGYKIGSFL